MRRLLETFDQSHFTCSSEFSVLSKFQRLSCLILLVLFLSGERMLSAQDMKITPDVVYGHKFGLANTFDVFTPPNNANGAAVLFMVSGGWYSKWIPPEKAQHLFHPLTEKGFTVFAVRHGSSPKFSIAEAVADVRRSVRFIRTQAEQFQIDPNRIGVYGMSAGGHLALMLGTTADEGDPNSDDAVQAASSRVQAVVAYVAPTDLRVAAQDAPNRLPAYDQFPALMIDQQTAAIDSPLLHVTDDDAPALLLAGAKDKLVPIFHSQLIHQAFQEKGVPSKLVEFENAGHGFTGKDAQMANEAMVNWFVTHLAPK